MNGNHLKTRASKDKNVRAVGVPAPAIPLESTKAFLRSYLLILTLSFVYSVSYPASRLQKSALTVHTHVGEPETDRRTHTPPNNGGITDVFAAIVALSHMPNHIPSGSSK